MKRSNRIVVILQVVLISAIMLFSIGMPYGLHKDSSASAPAQGKHVWVSDSSLYLPVSNHQEPNDNLHSLPSLRPVSQWLSLDVINKLKEVLIGHRNSNYLYFSVCLIRTGLTIPDIIYPFNYFW